MIVTRMSWQNAIKTKSSTEIEEVDAVIGTTSYQHIAEVVAEVLEGQKVKQFDDLQAHAGSGCSAYHDNRRIQQLPEDCRRL